MADKSPITIHPEYSFGDEVQLKARDPEGNRLRGVVVCIELRPGSVLLYGLCYGDGQTGTHYEFELESIDDGL